MDHAHLDQLARALATGAPRRQILQGVVGAALGGFFGSLPSLLILPAAAQAVDLKERKKCVKDYDKALKDCQKRYKSDPPELAACRIQAESDFVGVEGICNQIVCPKCKTYNPDSGECEDLCRETDCRFCDGIETTKYDYPIYRCLTYSSSLPCDPSNPCIECYKGYGCIEKVCTDCSSCIKETGQCDGRSTCNACEYCDSDLGICEYLKCPDGSD